MMVFLEAAGSLAELPVRQEYSTPEFLQVNEMPEIGAAAHHIGAENAILACRVVKIKRPG
ncbi:hypothetical protein IB223_05875 [Pseudoxanthomonas sp. PXM03]|jgi:hypothetical protein|uniref:hypothetical protein n=1 Tax=unclassified Pseudoxanthomonas TaxID=2645906 RepID=UPI00177AF70A|nr:hypothetical protein [Pseudoxanthomonas sp. PXM03]MBD9435619.1 hypothetical protein [Pseudoxanthomonas sp. PXM03]